MKRFCFFMFGLMLASSAFSQSIKSYVITSAGTALMGPDGAMYRSIGEPMNTEISDGEIMISQGFLNVTISAVLDTDDLLTEVVKAYPNPTRASINIEIPEMNGDYIYQLYDMTGQIIRTEQLNDFTSDVQLGDVNSGTYYMKVIKDDKSSKTLKIVKL